MAPAHSYAILERSAYRIQLDAEAIIKENLTLQWERGQQLVYQMEQRPTDGLWG